MGRNSYFQFKQFTVHQGQCAMKVTTDACVFGALVEATRPMRVLDIGTGTGLLALMVAQRFTEAHIDAVELDESSVLQARQNFQASPWADRLTVHQGSIQEFSSAHPYDLVIANPPFFANQLLSQSIEKRNAWHQTTLTSGELAKAISVTLAPQGTAWVLLPPSETQSFREAAQAHGLYLHQIVSHQSFHDSHPHLNSIQLGKEAAEEKTLDLVYYLDQKKSLSEKLRDLLLPYYLFL
ncbi:MAG: methyltransferase [Bacteroidota bacterium]